MADGPITSPRIRIGRRYALALLAALAAWMGLVGALVWLVYTRTAWLEQADQAHLREWLDESRVVRKTLPDLAGEYVALRESGLPADDDVVVRKAEEIAEQLRVMAEPTRMYQGYLPLFPEIYSLSVQFPGGDWPAIEWESPVPRPRQQNQTSVEVLDYPLPNRYGERARLRCEYRLHAFNQRQREAASRQQQQLFAIGLGVVSLLPIALLGYWSLQRERRRELTRLRSEQQVEHATNVALEEKIARQAAERAALELKSQLYASIGIMAGSYAHNIKNLLVRPNDLLARCLEADGLNRDQHVMLGEVRQTLGTVTERLQQILRTVRRDPSKAELTRIDLNDLLADMQRSWTDLAREKWKLDLTVQRSPQPLIVEGDASHLQQAIENLLFNARDATFEMRNHLRESARQATNLNEAGLRQALIDAAGWKGKVELRAERAGDRAVLVVRDNGIGMTEDVIRSCTQTHFSTKRDNALYEGYSAGMGLGLSFTVVVLEHHQAELKIESSPLKGAEFRVSFPTIV